MPKIIFILLLLTAFSWLVFPHSAIFAYFNDFEYSITNTFLVDTLDFSLFSPQNNFVPASKVDDMEPGDMVSRMIQVRQQGNLPFQYNIQTVKIGGDDSFCQALELEVKLQGVVKYPNNSNKGLMDFFVVHQMEVNDNNHTWQFKAFLPENVSDELGGKFCEFKFVFSAEQSEGVGFDDQEEIESILTSASEFTESPPPIPSNVIRISTSLERSH